MAAVRFTGEIAKIDEDRQLVFGIASLVQVGGQEITDKQGDVIAEEDIEKAAHDFMLWAGTGSNMHQRQGVSRAVESMVLSVEKQQALVAGLRKRGIEAVCDLRSTPWLVTFKVDDPKTWAEVKAGKLKMFSIAGRGERVPMPEPA